MTQIPNDRSLPPFEPSPHLKPGDLSPEFPMRRIIDIQPSEINPNWDKVTLNATYDGTNSSYYRRAR